MSSGEQSNSNASVLLPIVQPADIKEFTQGVFFFQELNPKARHSFHPARAKKTTIPVNTVSPHPKFLAYFNKTEIGRRKGLDSLTPNELAQVSSNLPIDLQQELLNDDDGGESDEFRNSQKFKFEQCKQAAFNLLMKVAFTLDTFDEDEQTVTEELESLLAENLDQLSANAAYENREWQTQAYKDEAAAVERESVDMHTPSVFQAPSTSESAKMATSPLNPQGTLRTPVPPLNSKKPFGNAFQANKSRAPSLVPVQQMATIVNDAVSLAGSENQDTLGPLPTANSMSKIKSAFRGSSRQRTTSGSDESETGSRRSRMSTRSGNRSGHLAGHSTPPEQIVTVCFSLESKECEEKGWIVHSAADSSAEDKRYTAVLIYKMIHASGEKIRDQDFIEEKEGRGDNGVQIDYWGNKKMNLRNQKQPKAVDLHGGDTRLLPWPIMPETTLSQAFPGYISLPDGTQCINYRTGQLAVLFDKLMPNASSFFCTIFSEEGNLQALIHPGCRGSITLPSSSGPSLIYNSKGGTLYNSRGDRDRVFTWPIFANRLPEPITLTLNDKMTIRVLNSNQIFLYFNYGVEKYKINLTKTVKGDPSFQKERGEMSIYLLSDLKFISKTARELESPKKKSAKSSQVKSPTKRGPSHSSAEMGGRGTVRGLDLPGEKERTKFENELLSLQVKVEYLFEEWLEFYRIHLGIPSPLLHNLSTPSDLQPRSVRRGLSARSTPAAALRVLEDLMRARSHSAAAKLKYIPRPHLTSQQSGRLSAMSPGMELSGIKRTASVPPIKLLQYNSGHGASSLGASSARSNLLSRAKNEDDENEKQNRTNRTARELQKKLTIAKTPREVSEELAQDKKQLACPISLRAKLSGQKVSMGDSFKCSCSPYHPPEVRDTEVDHFIQYCIPPHQILVVVVVDCMDKETFQGREMYDNIYCRMSRNRTSPCFQSKVDPFRLVYYDLANAKLPPDQKHTSSSDSPASESLTSLLQLRHRVHAGMLMMFCRGMLFFANEIFNGYGVSRHDLFSQIDRTKRDVDKNDWLPDDFKFTQPVKTSNNEVSITVIDVNEKEMQHILDGVKKGGGRKRSPKSKSDSRSKSREKSATVKTSPKRALKA